MHSVLLIICYFLHVDFIFMNIPREIDLQYLLNSTGIRTSTVLSTGLYSSSHLNATLDRIDSD